MLIPAINDQANSIYTGCQQLPSYLFRQTIASKATYYMFRKLKVRGSLPPGGLPSKGPKAQQMGASLCCMGTSLYEEIY